MTLTSKVSITVPLICLGSLPSLQGENKTVHRRGKLMNRRQVGDLLPMLSIETAVTNELCQILVYRVEIQQMTLEAKVPGTEASLRE